LERWLAPAARSAEVEIYDRVLTTNTGGTTLAFKVGDRVLAEISGRRKRSQLGAMRPRRGGVIAEVLRGDPNPRYRICWDAGGETVYSPANGGLHPDTEEHAA
jgi:hypothetical protein